MITKVVNRASDGRKDVVDIVAWSHWVGDIDVIVCMIVRVINVIPIINFRVLWCACVDRRVRVNVPGLGILLPHHLLFFAPRVAHLFQDDVAESIGNGEGRVEDLLEGRVLGSRCGKRHSVVHGAPLEGIPVSVIVHDGIHDAGIGQVVVRKSCEFLTVDNLPNRDCFYQVVVRGGNE